MVLVRTVRVEGRWSPSDIDAAGGSRTHTPLRTEAFEASASTIPPPPHASVQCMRALAVGVGLRARRGVATLQLDVPALVEAAHGERDEQDLHGHDQQREQPEQPGVEGGLGEAGLVAVEPARSGRKREDRQQDGERRADGQHASVPAGGEEGEQQVDDDVADLHRQRSLEHAPATDGDDQNERGGGEQQQHDGRARRLHDGLVAVGVRDDRAGRPLLGQGPGAGGGGHRGGHHSSDHTISSGPCVAPQGAQGRRAGVVELVDTLALGASGRKPVGVRVPPPASFVPRYKSTMCCNHTSPPASSRCACAVRGARSLEARSGAEPTSTRLPERSRGRLSNRPSEGSRSRVARRRQAADRSCSSCSSRR
jgi:hypothetical protein